MKYLVVFCLFAIVLCAATAQPAEYTTPKWDLATCEERAVQARRESKVCADYQCIQHSHGLVLDGVNCTKYETD